MGNNLRKSLENKRRKLIEKLLVFSVYKKEDKHLFELSLTELENEYRNFKLYSHPHSELGSIQWTSKESKNKSC